MKYRIKIFSFFIAFTLICMSYGQLHAQVAKDDIQKINEVFSKNKFVSIEMTYNVYESYISTKILKSEKASVKRMGPNQLYLISGMYILNNAKYSLILNEQDRTIILNKSSEKNNQKIIPMNLDSGLKGFSSIEFKKINDQLFCYYLKPKTTEYEEMDIYFNPLNFGITKLVLFQRMPMNLENSYNRSKEKKDKPRMEIIFDNFSTDRINPDIFSESNYVSISGSKATARPEYRGYKLVNNLLITSSKRKK